jgi:hypothetical protein
MEFSTTRPYLINALNETRRTINRLQHQITEMDAVLTDPTVKGKERRDIRSRRFKRLKTLESFVSQMHRVRCALAETEAKARFAANRPIAYVPAFVAYPATVMYNGGFPGVAWNATTTPGFCINHCNFEDEQHDAEVSFRPLQWDPPLSADLNRRIDDVSPLQEVQSLIESLRADSSLDRGSKTPRENISVDGEGTDDIDDKERQDRKESCCCSCHSAPLTRSASW